MAKPGTGRGPRMEVMDRLEEAGDARHADLLELRRVNPQAYRRALRKIAKDLDMYAPIRGSAWHSSTPTILPIYESAGSVGGEARLLAQIAAIRPAEGGESSGIQDMGSSGDEDGDEIARGDVKVKTKQKRGKKKAEPEIAGMEMSGLSAAAEPESKG